MTDLPVVAVVGPTATVLTALALFALLVLRGTDPLLPVLAAGVAYLGLVLAGAVAYGLAHGVAAALAFAGRTATSVFTLAAVVLAALAGLAHLLVLRARTSGAGRPRWPWEDRFDP